MPAPAAAPAAEAPVGGGPEERLLARVVPDAEPAAPAGSDPGAVDAGGVPDAAPVADVRENEPEPEPDPHTHAAAEGNWLPRQGSHPADPVEAVTDKGLPKRTPRSAAAAGARVTEAAPAEPPRRVDADELRRRLGGFYQGAQDGRRVAAAELERDQEQDPQDPQDQHQGKSDQGGTAQEART